jgi:hypothetical protein
LYTIDRTPILSLLAQIYTYGPVTRIHDTMVFNPSGPISFTKTTLSYPVYTVDFDPYNRGYIVVAGGGGEGRSGVGNKIVGATRRGGPEKEDERRRLTWRDRQSWTQHRDRR